jgi:exodeoxyribonuclease V alpha subunit
MYQNIVQLVTDKLVRYVGASPMDIQVLVPMKKGAMGVETLNGILQRYINPPSSEKREHLFGDTLFREGDKVMQMKNNYKLEWEITGKYNLPIQTGQGVFNGDIGIIREINEYASMMQIEFDEGKRVNYRFEELDELELAYAITIHKSQGSEYPAVVIPLLGVPGLLTYRNLLYTAVTRAKKCVTILGSDAIVEHMILGENKQKRYTGLCYRIQEMERVHGKENV